VPASYWSIAFEQAENGSANGRVNVRPEEIVPDIDLTNMVLPLLPDGSPGVLQQGILDPVTNSTVAKLPIYVQFWCDVQGDEFFLLVNRATIAQDQSTWDFTQQDIDLPFSNIYGTGNGEHPEFPHTGIFYQFGQTP